MLFAVVARPAVYGGKVVSYDAAAALKVPGVVQVVEIPGTPPPRSSSPLGGVAVVARNTWAAIKGREALKITWDDGPNATTIRRLTRPRWKSPRASPAQLVHERGNVETGMAKAARRVQAEYYIPHMAQAPMEPPAATVRIVGDPLRGVDGHAGAPGHARSRREAPRFSERARDGERHAARRRLRAQVQARLRRRGGARLASNERRAGEADLDARRRRAARLLPHRLGRAPRGPGSTARASRSPGCIGARRRRSRRYSAPIRSTNSRPSSAWAWSTFPF